MCVPNTDLLLVLNAWVLRNAPLFFGVIFEGLHLFLPIARENQIWWLVFWFFWQVYIAAFHQAILNQALILCYLCDFIRLWYTKKSNALLCFVLYFSNAEQFTPEDLQWATVSRCAGAWQRRDKSKYKSFVPVFQSWRKRQGAWTGLQIAERNNFVIFQTQSQEEAMEESISPVKQKSSACIYQHLKHISNCNF